MQSISFAASVVLELPLSLALCGLRRSSTLDFKTTARTIAAIATFVRARSDNFGHEAFHRQTDAAVLAGQCREGTPYAADHDLPVALHVSRRTELIVQHLACGDGSRPEISGRSLSPRQFVGECLACASEKPRNLLRRERFRKDSYELGQERDVRLRK